MKLFGHPLHPALVHFPVTLLSMGTGCDVAAILGVEGAAQFSGPLISVGLITALVAMIAGLMDFGAVPPSGESAANKYLYLMSMAVLLYLFSVLMRLKDGAFIDEPQLYTVALSVGGLATMVIGAWFGAELVYRHGAGAATDETDRGQVDEYK